MPGHYVMSVYRNHGKVHTFLTLGPDKDDLSASHSGKLYST